MNLFKSIRSLFSKTNETNVEHLAETENIDNLQNLMVVLREGNGSIGKDTSLTPMKGFNTTDADGKDVALSLAWFSFIGDMHLRFVYDSPHIMRNLTAEEFESLKLTPGEALRLAVCNIKKAYGHPKIRPLDGNLMFVKCSSPDLDSSYFLDDIFWQNQLIKHPEGLVVGVPERSGLLFVPASDSLAVAKFRQSIGEIFAGSENKRISSALYLYKDNCWSVFQDPQSIK